MANLFVQLVRIDVQRVDAFELAMPTQEQERVANAQPRAAIWKEQRPDERGAHAGKLRRVCHSPRNRCVGLAHGLLQARFGRQGKG